MADLSGLSNEMWILVFIVTVILIAVNFLLAFAMVSKSSKTELEFTKRYFIGLTSFLFVHAACRIFYFLHDFYFSTEQMWWEIGALLGLLSITILIEAIEATIFKKTKHLLTAIGIIGLILMTIQLIANAIGMVLPINLSQIVQMLVVSVLGLVVLFIYIYVAIKSMGEIRKSAIIMTIGILLFEIGQIAHTTVAIALLGDLAIVIAPILMTVALTLLYFAVIKGYS